MVHSKGSAYERSLENLLTSVCSKIFLPILPYAEKDAGNAPYQ